VAQQWYAYTLDAQRAFVNVAENFALGVPVHLRENDANSIHIHFYLQQRTRAIALPTQFAAWSAYNDGATYTLSESASDDASVNVLQMFSSTNVWRVSSNALYNNAGVYVGGTTTSFSKVAPKKGEYFHVELSRARRVNSLYLENYAADNFPRSLSIFLRDGSNNYSLKKFTLPLNSTNATLSFDVSNVFALRVVVSSVAAFGGLQLSKCVFSLV
jgi:hypothetical protein